MSGWGLVLIDLCLVECNISQYVPVNNSLCCVVASLIALASAPGRSASWMHSASAAQVRGAAGSL